MAVSALRTVLVSHAQASWNRLLRSTSKSSRLWLVIIVGLTVVGGLLPTIFALGAGGWFLGSQATDDPLFAAILALVLTVVPIFGGLMSGLSGGTTNLHWEAFKIYPVRPRSLFAAELVAGLADIITSIETLLLISLCVGAAASSVQMAIAMPLVLLTSVLTLLCLRLVFGSIATRLAKRMRVVLVFLPLLAWMMGGPLLPKLLPYFKRAADSTPLLERVTAVAHFTPTLMLIEAVQAALRGDWRQVPHGLLALIPMTLLALAAFWAVSRERDTSLGGSTTGKQSLWSFSRPMFGVARLQIATLARSISGRFGFVMPVVTVVLIRGPFAELMGRGQWIVPASFAYCSLAATNLLFNQFGLDGHGIKALLLLPIEETDLLNGKLLGFTAWHSLQVLLLMGLLSLLGHPDVLPLLTGVVIYACCFLFTAIVGQFTSVWAPRPMSKQGMRAGQMPLPVVALSLGVVLVNTGIFGGSFWLLNHFVPRFASLGMLVWAGLLFALQRFTQKQVAGLLVRSKEKLVEVLGAAA